MSKCNEKDVSKRGPGHPQQTAYQNTVADYTNTVAGGDNTILGLTCDASVYIGAVVRMSGSTVVNAIADSVSNSQVIGICVAKDNATTCDVQVTGFTIAIFSGLDPANIYFLSDTTPGAITTTIPTSANHVVLNMGQAYTATRFIIEPKIRLVRT